ncbi:hypothetical protein CYMTET_48449 [Cymbomonas tetramitiformis]|uniref:Uncharacterized protein n=1 Tax=Cymbomonas tetramitiformis TaxID=36881 RepID=A0AAE0BS83_9CHLO|nr:hypothetical protein CYMTET_48449 [Cymbomonas tetramitiformis]
MSMAFTPHTRVSTVYATAVARQPGVRKPLNMRRTVASRAVCKADGHRDDENLQKTFVSSTPAKLFYFQAQHPELISSSTHYRQVMAHAADDADLARSSLDSFSDALDSLDDEKDYDVITGQELREISEEKWGRAYDIRISQRRNQLNQLRLYVQVMWKFLGQKSFPMSERKYMEQLDAVAELLTEWGVADQVRKDLLKTNKRPVVDTTGGNAVSIPLDVET